MAEANSGVEAKSVVSPVGAFLIGLFLGAGLLFVGSTLNAKRFKAELEKTQRNLQIAERRCQEAMAELAKHPKPGEAPKAAP